MPQRQLDGDFRRGMIGRATTKAYPLRPRRLPSACAAMSHNPNTMINATTVPPIHVALPHHVDVHPGRFARSAHHAAVAPVPKTDKTYNHGRWPNDFQSCCRASLLGRR